MSRLSYASVNEAFILGSEQIKNTQEEIARLKSLILETSGITPPKEPEKPKPKPEPESSYQRIGPPDQVSATFVQPGTPGAPGVPSAVPQEDNIDLLVMKLIKHPKFDDIVKSYISDKHPDWVLSETKYTPSEPKSIFSPMTNAIKENFGSGQSKETFGAFCSVFSNIIIFLVISLVLYVACSIFVDR
jgi:hypothetical protein